MHEQVPESSSLDLMARIRALCLPRTPASTGRPSRIRRLQGVRAILFDVYGTMLTSGLGEAGHVIAPRPPAALAEDALRSAGLRLAGPGVGEHVVRGLDAAIRRGHDRAHAAGVMFPEIDIRECWAETLDELRAGGELESGGHMDLERIAIEYECRINPAWPMPGLGNMLRAAHQAGLCLGIVSNAQFYTPLILSAFHDETGWRDGIWEPDACAWSYRLREAKPSPRLVRTALDALRAACGCSAGEVLCVGNDLRLDVAAAAGQGCRTALFAGDAGSLRLREDDPECAGVSPDLELGSWDELAPALGWR
ncbi:MAG: HAD family hydrolase [Kiritimatiellae bacterium]|nr:HAD family hydrolase [Kiritimatiellia bacterium]